MFQLMITVLGKKINEKEPIKDITDLETSMDGSKVSVDEWNTANDGEPFEDWVVMLFDELVAKYTTSKMQPYESTEMEMSFRLAMKNG